MNRAVGASYKGVSRDPAAKPLGPSEALDYIVKMMPYELEEECKAADAALQGAHLRRQAVQLSLEVDIRRSIQRLSSFRDTPGLTEEVVDSKLSAHVTRAAAEAFRGLVEEGLITDPQSHPDVEKFNRSLETFRRSISGNDRGLRALTLLTKECSTEVRPAMEIEVLELICLTKAYRREDGTEQQLKDRGNISVQQLKDHFENIDTERFILQ